MTRLEQFRENNPEYKYLSEENLLKLVHAKHYQSMDFDTFKERALSVPEPKKKDRSWIDLETAPTIRGATLAVENIADSLNAIPNAALRAIGVDYQIPKVNLPKQDPVDSFVGKGVESVSQFMTGYAVGGVAGKLPSTASKTAQYAYALARGAFSDAFAFDPKDPNFVNFLHSVGVPKTALTEWLESNPDDPDALNRFKNALVGGVLGGSIDAGVTLFRGLTSLRANHATKKMKETLAKAEEKASKAVSKEEVEMAAAVRDHVPQQWRDVEVPEEVRELMIGGESFLGQRNQVRVPREDLIRQPEGDRLVNMKFEKFESPDEVKRALELGTKAYRIEKKSIPIEETMRDARSIGWSDSDIVRLSKEVEDLPALIGYTREVAVTRANALKEMASTIEAGSLKDIAAFDEEFARIMMIVNSMVGQASTAGRALRMYREAAKESAENISRIREIIQERGGEEKFRELAKSLSLLDDAESLLKAGKQVYKQNSLPDGISEWIINMSFLSGPATFVKNIEGNVLMNVLNVVERGVAAGISKILGTKGGVSGQEAAVYAASTFQGLSDASRAMLKSLKQDDSVIQVGDRVIIDPQTKIEIDSRKAISSDTLGRYVPNAVKSVVGKEASEAIGKRVDTFGQAVRTPGRALNATDSFFKTVAYRQELSALAIRHGKELIEKGKMSEKDLDTYVQTILSNPSKELHEASLAHSRTLTFTEQLGPIGQHLVKISNSTPFAKIVIPFVRVSTNLLKQAGHRSSVFAFLSPKVRADWAAGGARRDIALAKMVTGTAVTLPIYFLAEQGLITGSPPKDPYLKRSFYEAGMQPYSFKDPITGKWVSYEFLDPLSTLFAAAANYAQYGSYMTEDEQENYWSSVIAGNAQILMDKSWHQGLDSLYKALNGESGKTMEEWFKDMAATATVPNAITQLSRGLGNNNLNITETYTEKVKKRVGDAGDLVVRHDSWGKPIAFEGSWGPDVLDPINPHFVTRPTDSKIRQFVWDQRMRLSVPSRKLDGIELTHAQHQKLIRMAGEPALKVLEEMASQPNWDRMPKGLRESIINQVRDQYARAAREQMKAEIHEESTKQKLKDVDKLLN